MSVGRLCRDITNFGFNMIEAEFAWDANVHKVDQISANKEALIWVQNQDLHAMIEIPSRVNDYCSLIASKDYSYLMNDGGIIQTAYMYDNDRISKHRLLYFPCPFRIDDYEVGEITGELVPLLDRIVETEDFPDNFLLRSPIRFDYAPHDASEFHPASHMILNDPDCRIPVKSPLRVHTFIQFVFENFYLTAWKHPGVQESFARLREEGREGECLSAHDRELAFLDWN